VNNNKQTFKATQWIKENNDIVDTLTEVVADLQLANADRPSDLHQQKADLFRIDERGNIYITGPGDYNNPQLLTERIHLGKEVSAVALALNIMARHAKKNIKTVLHKKAADVVFDKRSLYNIELLRENLAKVLNASIANGVFDKGNVQENAAHDIIELHSRGNFLFTSWEPIYSTYLLHKAGLYSMSRAMETYAIERFAPDTYAMIKCRDDLVDWQYLQVEKFCNPIISMLAEQSELSGMGRAVPIACCNGHKYCVLCLNEIDDENHIFQCAEQITITMNEGKCPCGCDVYTIEHQQYFYKVLVYDDWQKKLVQEDIRNCQDYAVARSFLHYLTNVIQNYCDYNIEHVSSIAMARLGAVHSNMITYMSANANEKPIQFSCKYCDRTLALFTPVIMKTTFADAMAVPCYKCGHRQQNYHGFIVRQDLLAGLRVNPPPLVTVIDSSDDIPGPIRQGVSMFAHGDSAECDMAYDIQFISAKELTNKESVMYPNQLDYYDDVMGKNIRLKQQRDHTKLSTGKHWQKKKKMEKAKQQMATTYGLRGYDIIFIGKPFTGRYNNIEVQSDGSIHENLPVRMNINETQHHWKDK